MVLICAVKIPDTVTKLIASEMHHQEAGQRADAIQRFAVLWRFRHQVWPRMEDKASLIFRVRKTFTISTLLVWCTEN